MVQVDLTGPPVPLSADMAQNIGLAVHELATNALKYGALSVPDGRLLISWSVQFEGGQKWVTLNWRERDGPRIAAPTRRGFGHVIIDGMVAQSLNGRATLDFASDGLNWQLSFPLDRPAPA
jgi:two-component system, chemotaxis family, CheB/CheR fusion protein